MSFYTIILPYVQDNRISVDTATYPTEEEFENKWGTYTEAVPQGSGQLDVSDYYNYLIKEYYDQLIPKAISDYIFENYETEPPLYINEHEEYKHL